MGVLSRATSTLNKVTITTIVAILIPLLLNTNEPPRTPSECRARPH